MVEQTIPHTAGIVVPVLSAIQPLNGASTTMQAELGSKYKAATAVSILSPDTRKNGIRKKTPLPARNERNRAAEPTENAIDLNISKGSMGVLTLPSQTKKAKNKITAKINPPTISGDVQPKSCAKETDNITESSKPAEKTVPSQSNFDKSVRFLSPPSGSLRRTTPEKTQLIKLNIDMKRNIALVAPGINPISISPNSLVKNKFKDGSIEQIIFNYYQEYCTIEKGFRERSNIYELYHALVNVHLWDRNYIDYVSKILKKYN